MDQFPRRCLFEDRPQRRILLHQYPVHVPFIQNLVPLRLDENYLQVILEELIAIQVMAIIHQNLGLWIQPVNQISAPLVWTEDWLPNVAIRDHLGGLDREAFVVEIRIQELGRPEPSAVQASPQAENEYHHQPEVALKTHFQLFHANAEAVHA